MSREAHVQFCESLGVRFPGATHPIITGRSKELLEGEIQPLVEQFLARTRPGTFSREDGHHPRGERF
jgi:hypothetical protein